MAARTFDPQPIYMNVLPTPTEWAVDGRIPEDGVTCILGKPGSGKTFATIDVACCMATGLDCWGQKVGPPQRVIYIAAEAGPGVKLRIIAWIISHLDALKAAGVELVIDDQGRQSLPNLLLWPKAVNLRPKRPGEAAAAVTAAINEIEASGLNADVLCIDTLFSSSVGAKLTLPEELLPILVELAKLAVALKAKTCLLVHHTVKSGDDYFGTVAFLATISALILFEAKKDDKTTVTVKCERIREGEAFAPFEIKFQKVMMKTTPDKFGRTQQETLAVVPGIAAAPPRSSQPEADLEFIMTTLKILLLNKATTVQLVAKLQELKRDKNGALLKGWSTSSIYEKLATLRERGRLTGGGGEGEYNSVVNAWGDAVQPDNSSPNRSSPDPLRGIWSGWSGSGNSESTPKPLQNENWSGSSQGRAEGETTPENMHQDTDEELAKKALSQLG
jgi:hypothetical protein